MLFQKKKLPFNYRVRFYPQKWLSKKKQFYRSCFLNKVRSSPSWYVKPFFLPPTNSIVEKDAIVRADALSLYRKFWNRTWKSNLSRVIRQFTKNYTPKVLKSDHVGLIMTTLTTRLFYEKVRNLCSFYKILFSRSLNFLGGFIYHRKNDVIFAYDYKVYFTFHPSRFYINLRSYTNINYFSLAVGLLLKFFKYKKSLKKTKTFKFLLVKFFRKLLITTNMQRFVLFFKRSPVLLNEVIRFLTQPLIAPFYDPVRDRTVLEDENKPYLLQVHYIYFLKSVSYTKMKNKQKGRLKRKITKKIVRKNRIVDEA